MQILINCAIVLVVSLVVAWVVYPKILLISIHKNIVDSPNARKLQKMPVPILGGFVVFSGILVALLCVSSQVDIGALFTILCIMTVMLMTGLADDIISLTAKGRFLIEIFVMVILMMSNHSLTMHNFHGLWGIYEIPMWLAVPLTIVAGVGIINATNLIDGIDGLSSGYCVFACGLFAFFFYLTNQTLNLFLALASVGGLIPFFMHNVFGKYSKMFIGDAGTLLMGSIMAYFVITALHLEPCEYGLQDNFGTIPMLLSILAVPVFDTLRVMITRILKGTSPFNPDKTHLHHMFIRLGFSHIGATVTILSLNAFVVLIWLTMYLLGYSQDMQLFVVVLLCISITVLLYQYVEHSISKSETTGKKLPIIIRILTIIGHNIGLERGPFLKFLGRWMDKCVKQEERKMLVGEGKNIE